MVFECKLDLLAEVAVTVGLGLARGQELVISAPLEALPLVRRITEHAYRAGASLVSTLFADDEATLLRYQYALDETFDKAAVWLQDGLAAAYRSGAARLAITGANPALLAGQDAQESVDAPTWPFPKHAARARTHHAARINWTIVAAATPAWAKLVFPATPEDEAIASLWEAIFRTTRIDVPDPVADWRAHGAQLQSRVKFSMNNASMPYVTKVLAQIHHRIGRRSSLVRRWFDRQERHLWFSEHANRGSIHYTAQRPSRW